jgi:hypothetical protein
VAPLEPGFDPALPELPLALDPDRAARLVAPGAEVRRARRHDTKYEPGRRCVSAYELELVDGHRVFAMVAVTPEGLEMRPFAADEGLPGLAEALDPARMAARFATLRPGSAVEWCTVVPVRYKPGARCVLRYQLGADGRRCYGKLLAGGCRQQVATLAALRDGGSRSMPEILPVEACWDDLGLLVQPAVEDADELNQVAFDPQVAAAARQGLLRAAGAGLAGLHAAAPPQAPPATLAADLADLRGLLPPLAHADQDLAGRYQAALVRLQAHAADPGGRLAAGHGAFRTDQFLIRRRSGALVLIDLDSACLAEPARDLGNFLAYLDWKAIRRPELAAEVAGAAAAFTRGYGSVLPWPAAERVALWRAASLLKIAGRRYRSLTVSEWHLVPRLADAAAALLAGR